MCFLVDGFNPFEEYQSKWESSPNRAANKKKWNRHPVSMFSEKSTCKPPPALLINVPNTMPHTKGHGNGVRACHSHPILDGKFPQWNDIHFLWI